MYRFGISLAPTLIALIVTIAGIGGFVIVEKYQTLKAQTGADAEMNRLRNGVVAILDLVSVHNKLDLTLEDGRLDSKAGRELVEAVDALYLRADTFEKLAAERPDPAAKHLIGQLGALIQVFDAAVAGGYQELEVKKFTFEQLIQQTISSIVNYYDIQKFSHLSAVQRQDEMLTHLVEIVVLMLGAFIAITLVSLVLWRSEQRARVRGREAEERARHLAYFDTLTGLPNRASFLLEGDRALSENALPALFLIDLDEFKEINDTHGHPVGDAVLQGLGNRIRAAFEEQSGFAARLGGDEFAAVLPEHRDIESLEGFGARLLERLGQPLLVEGLRLHPRVSVGIATPDMIEEDDSRSLKSLLRAADYALYRAKADGRFTSRIYNAEMAAALAHRRMLKQSMPAALEDEEFYLEFQPQVDLATGVLIGFEALVRWRREDAILLPSSFIDIAEESDFVTRLDEWVMQQAMLQALEWQVIAGRPVLISVNLSARNLRDGGIVGRVRNLLDETGLPPDRLTLEMTESVFIDDLRATTEILASLTALGVKIALDDFGTGYSSLSYLRRLEVNEVKIDRAFVIDIESSDRTRMMLDALVDIARGLEMRLVVEGIETAGQAQLLVQQGGNIGQGFLFAPSLGVATARELVASRSAFDFASDVSGLRGWTAEQPAPGMRSDQTGGT